MMVNKKTIEDLKIVEKSWGYESIFVNNGLYCGKILTCFKNKWSSEGKFHYHKKKDESFIGLEGKILLQIKEDGKTEFITIFPKEVVRILPGTKHRFMALTEKSKFIEVSTQHIDIDSYYD